MTITAGNTAVVMIILQEATPPGPFDNSAPYITSFWLSSDQVEPSTNVILGAQAYDPDGDPLTYAWSSTAGSFSAPTSTDTNWLAPSTDGAYPITFTVTDPHNASDSLTATVNVQSVTSGAADVSVTFNVYPRVTNVTSTLSRLQAGGPVTMLSAVASDADGDALTYAWSSDCAGTFGPNAVSTTFALTDSAATACAITVTVNDARGAQTTGTIHLVAGPPPTPNRAPVITAAFQSAETAGHSGQVTLHIDATDPDGDPINFQWSPTTGSISYVTTTAGTSEVIWTAPGCFITPTTITGHAIDGIWDTWATFTVTNQSANCGSTFNGSMSINGAGDVAQLAGVQHITGDLYINAASLTSLDLSGLSEIDGYLVVYNFGGASISLPSLLTLGGIYQTSGATIVVPQVVSMGEIWILGAGSLSANALESAQRLSLQTSADLTLSLPALTQITANMTIADEGLTTFPSFPNLASIGSLGLYGNANGLTASFPALSSCPVLNINNDETIFNAPLLSGELTVALESTLRSTFTLPASAYVTDLYINSCPNLSSVSLSYPTTVQRIVLQYTGLTSYSMSGASSVGYAYFIGNSALQSIDFPSLPVMTGPLLISDNDALTTVSAPNLFEIDSSLTIQNNPLYPTCRATALATQTSPAGGFSISGNGAVCN